METANWKTWTGFWLRAQSVLHKRENQDQVSRQSLEWSCKRENLDQILARIQNEVGKKENPGQIMARVWNGVSKLENLDGILARVQKGVGKKENPFWTPARVWSQQQFCCVVFFFFSRVFIMVFKISFNRDHSVIVPYPPLPFPRLWSLLACSTWNFLGWKKRSPLCPAFYCSAVSQLVSAGGSDGTDGVGGHRVCKAWSVRGNVVPILPGLRRGRDFSCGRTAGDRAARLQGQEGSLG